MQEYVSLKIKVDSDFSKVAAFIKEYFDPNAWDEDRIKDWCVNLKFDPSQNTIENNFEGKMYVFDYEDIFPEMIEELAAAAPDSDFSGEVIYYCDEWGEGPGCYFTHIDGELKTNYFDASDE